MVTNLNNLKKFDIVGEMCPWSNVLMRNDVYLRILHIPMLRLLRSWVCWGQCLFLIFFFLLLGLLYKFQCEAINCSCKFTSAELSYIYIYIYIYIFPRKLFIVRCFLVLSRRLPKCEGLNRVGNTRFSSIYKL